MCIPTLTLYFLTITSLNIPGNHVIHRNLGNCYKARGQLAKAIKHFNIVHASDPKNINILFELSFLLMRQGLFDEALKMNNKILAIHPQALGPQYNSAIILRRKGSVQQAIDKLKKILTKKPDYENSRFALGLALLYKGNFEEGWNVHDHFLRTTSRYSPAHLKQWVRNGMLKGKIIVVRHEGGLGDSIQFIRYVPLLKQLGVYTIVICPPALFQLYQRCPGIDELIESNNKDQINKIKYDAHTTTMTLPALFYSNEDTIPRNIPYILPDPTLSSYWKSVLEKDTNLKIGICWNAAYKSQPNIDIGSRSIPFSTLMRIGVLPHISLYSLQKDALAEQYPEIPDTVNITFFDTNFDNDHGRFMDTVALMQHLDLIISVDTSIAHLAGAVGRPVWLLLNHSTVDWRWIYGRTDSPWYPSMRIFQQPAPFDWDSVIEHVIKDLIIFNSLQVS